jgi:hypothetical protein
LIGRTERSDSIPRADTESRWLTQSGEVAVNSEVPYFDETMKWSDVSVGNELLSSSDIITIPESLDFVIQSMEGRGKRKLTDKPTERRNTWLSLAFGVAADVAAGVSPGVAAGVAADVARRVARGVAIGEIVTV